MGDISYKFLANSEKEFKHLEEMTTFFKKYIRLDTKNNDALRLVVKQLGGQENIIEIIPDSRGSTIKEVSVHTKNANGGDEVKISSVIYTERSMHVTINGISFVVTFKKGEYD